MWPARLAISFDNKFSKRLKSYFDQLSKSLLLLFRPHTASPLAELTLTRRPRLLLVVAAAFGFFLCTMTLRPTLNATRFSWLAVLLLFILLIKSCFCEALYTSSFL